MNARAALMALVLAAAPLAASAADPADWPPPEPVQKRMAVLQSVIRDPASSLEQREKARDELRSMLKIRGDPHPGPLPGSGEKPSPHPHPGPLPRERENLPRAAIQPFPSAVKPAENPALKLPAPPVAHVEIVHPPKPLVIPQSGAPAIPAPGVAVDPRTGQILHETPGGYIDPRTGEFIPR